MPAGRSTLSCTRSGNDRPVTSVMRSWATVYPPPEYLKRLPGVVSTMIDLVFAGAPPFSTCTTVGTVTVAGYPGKPLTVVPAVWLSRRRSVTCSVVMCALAGTVHVFSHLL